MTWNALRDLLVDQYDDFRRRLTRRLGSAELADESLSETWLRLHRLDEVGSVRSPSSYLLRMAMNIATDHRRTESRLARRSDIRAALDVVPDPAPGPEREVAARMQMEALHRAIAVLPHRSRDILIAGRIQGLSQKEIADHFGITPRMVRMELRRALDHCEHVLDGNAGGRADLSGAVSVTTENKHAAPAIAAKAGRE